MYREEDTIPIKIKSHEDYIKLLDSLKSKTYYIVIVQICCEDKTDEKIIKAKSCMQLVSKKNVNRWLGTTRRDYKAVEYIFISSDNYFNYLSRYSSFFFNYQDSYGCDIVQETNFGIDDIAFLDKNKNVLFFTTTHEGFANIHNSLT